MAKQYRLKITWSNGDSEYMGPLENTKSEIFAFSWLADGFLKIGDKAYFTSHIRKAEYEEVYQEASEKF
jgi:hypothetical protein